MREGPFTWVVGGGWWKRWQSECLQVDPPQLGGCGAEEGAGQHVPCPAPCKAVEEGAEGEEGGGVSAPLSGSGSQGGILILEPQPWKSYKNNCNVSEVRVANPAGVKGRLSF